MSQVLDAISLDEIEEQQLSSLLSLRIKESPNLEYKLELNMTSDKEKRELCKDLSALANSQGGYILFGIKETNGYPTSIEGIRYDDSIGTRLRQVIASGISHRMQNIGEKSVSLKNGNKVLILKIEPDGYLHQVKYGDNRYYKREGTITLTMESADVETFFRKVGQASGLDESARFVEKYYLSLKSKNYFRGVDGKAICTIAIIPDVPSYKLDLSYLPKNFITLFQPIDCSTWNWEITGHSIFTYGKLAEEKVPHAVTEVTAFGEVKAFNSILLDDRYFPTKLPKGASGYIPSIAYEKEIINSTHMYLSSLKTLGVNPPYYIYAAILNANGYIMYRDPGEIHRSRIYQGEDIRPEVVRISSETAFGSWQSLAKEIRPLFDFIWREFGFEGSYNYGDEGWIQKR